MDPETSQFETPPSDPEPADGVLAVRGQVAVQLGPPSRRWPSGFTAVAWVVILLGCGTMVGLHQFQKAPADTEARDTLGLVIMRLQSQYFVAASEFQDGLYPQAGPALNIGTVDQRQQFVVLAGDLEGPDEAVRVLDEFEAAVLTEQQGRPEFGLSEDQARLSSILRRLYTAREAGPQTGPQTGPKSGPESGPEAGPENETPPDPAAVLDEDDLQFLRTQMGWFGDLALTPAGSDDRDDVMRQPRRLFWTFVTAFVVGIGGAAVGFVGLVVVLVFAGLGRISGNMPPSPTHHGLYAETFGVWIWLFLGCQVVAGFVALGLPDSGMLLAAIGFLASLGALGWPVARGLPWRQVRQDVGWTVGRRPALEPLIGIGGYLMGLPMLAVGVGLTLVLLLTQQSLAGEVPAFAPSGGPAHPVVQQLADATWWPKLQVLLVASVAAPIVEETMFRGVLYRHLRDASRGLARAGSVILSATVSGFLFAIIHPQGWVAVPALMSLAYAFVLVREWRGTIIPSMIVHAVSNGLVMTVLMVCLSSSG